MKRRFDILLHSVDDASSREWCWRDDWNISGQSAFMLLAKFQHLNTLSCTALAKMVLRQPASLTLQRGIDLRDAQRFDLPKMAELLRMSLADVAAAFPPRHVLLSGVTINAALRWCPQCALKGVHLTVFQVNSCDRCPVHGCTLRDRCASCGQLLMAYRLRADVFRGPFSCQSCGHDWAPALRWIDDRALRLSLSYRQKLTQALARGWFGRRSSAVGRLFRGPGKTGGPQAWLASALPRGVGGEVGENCYEQILLSHSYATQCLLGWQHGRSDTVQRPDGEWRTGMPSPLLASGTRAADEKLMDAVAYYKAIKRHLMRSIGAGHRACVVTSTRHLTWRLDGRTTTPFCPVAHAVLRWRTKWEGVGVPSHLLTRREHGPLGVMSWLSLLAPVGLAQWSRAIDHWVILHVFAQACLDSFHWYLQEARGATDRSQPVWMSFPVVDFPEPEWAVLDTELQAASQRLFIAPRKVRCGTNKFVQLSVGNEHHRQHARVLSQNIAPEMALPAVTRRRDDTKFSSVKTSTDPLTIDTIAGIFSTAMVLASLEASDAE